MRIPVVFKTQDGSFLNCDGTVLYFSCERFIRDICEGDCCFICGISRQDADFNDEHILPDWLLKRYKLHGSRITLPNGDQFPYSRYKIPCCASCNSLMGVEIEAPVAALLAQGLTAVNDYIVENGSLLFNVWMGLIFLKTHLRDRNFRFEPDRRLESGSIAQFYDWETLHHLHCVARSFYTNAILEPGVTGSFVTLPFDVDSSRYRFDFSDLFDAQSMFIRLDDIALYTVFDDANGALNALMPKIERIEGSLNQLQSREFLAELAFVNCHIKERPTFRSVIKPPNFDYTITANVPEHLQLNELDFKNRGEWLYRVIKEFINGGLELGGLTGQAAAELVKQGDVTFLFDKFGKFIHQPPPRPQV